MNSLEKCGKVGEMIFHCGNREGRKFPEYGIRTTTMIVCFPESFMFYSRHIFGDKKPLENLNSLNYGI
jgi:hypothetical protein